MIIARKPWLIYDVDVAGALGVTLLCAVAGWFVVRPCARIWQEYNRTTATYLSIEQKLDADSRDSRQYRAELDRLTQVVEAQVSQAPRPDSFSQQLRRMTAIAEQEHVEILTVAPQPPLRSGPYVITDVHLGGRADSRSFLRFLDRVAAQDPYQSLRAFSIAHARDSDKPRCELNWTVRLYLLPPTQFVQGGPR